MVKWKKFPLWCLLNGALGYCAYLGTVEGVGWAGNVVKFTLWYMCITFLLTNFAPPPVKVTLRQKGKPVPDWLSLSFDLALAILLAAYGWFFYATLAVIQAALYLGLYAESDTPSTGDTTKE